MTDTITTSRLLLRRWTEHDITPFAQMNGDPAVMEFFPSVLTFDQSVAMYQRIEEQFEKRGYGLWVVEVDGTFAGFTGLNDTTIRTPMGPHVEIGWRLARSAWGQGIATEAANAVVSWAFGTWGMSEIFSFTTRTNVRSEAVMRRIRMRRRTDLDFKHPSSPTWWGADHIVYQLTSDQWRSPICDPDSD